MYLHKKNPQEYLLHVLVLCRGYFTLRNRNNLAKLFSEAIFEVILDDDKVILGLFPQKIKITFKAIFCLKRFLGLIPLSLRFSFCDFPCFSGRETLKSLERKAKTPQKIKENRKRKSKEIQKKQGRGDPQMGA